MSHTEISLKEILKKEYPQHIENLTGCDLVDALYMTDIWAQELSVKNDMDQAAKGFAAVRPSAFGNNIIEALQLVS